MPVSSPLVGERLYAAPVSGVPPFTYAWKACDSSGANCVTAAGSPTNARTYTLVSADVGSTIRVTVTDSQAKATTSPPTGTVAANDGPIAGWWSSSFENGDSLPTEWTVWGQDGQESMFGTYGAQGSAAPNQIGTAAGYGIPNSPDGSTHVCSLYHAAGDTAIHHKLYKGWTSNWPLGGEPRPAVDVTPTDVSGRYICAYYIPSSNLILPGSDGTGLAQWKEDYNNQSDTFESIPSYGVGLHTGVGGYPCLYSDAWYRSDYTSSDIDARPYLDRWFTIEMRLFQHDHIDFYIDGALKWTAPNQDWGADADVPYSVGRRWYLGHHGDIDGVDVGGVVTRNRGWTYGVGNYVTATDVQSTVYVDNARILPLP